MIMLMHTKRLELRTGVQWVLAFVIKNKSDVTVHNLLITPRIIWFYQIPCLLSETAERATKALSLAHLFRSCQSWCKTTSAWEGTGKCHFLTTGSRPGLDEREVAAASDAGGSASLLLEDSSCLLPLRPSAAIPGLLGLPRASHLRYRIKQKQLQVQKKSDIAIDGFEKDSAVGHTSLGRMRNPSYLRRELDTKIFLLFSCLF